MSEADRVRRAPRIVDDTIEDRLSAFLEDGDERGTAPSGAPLMILGGIAYALLHLRRSV